MGQASEPAAQAAYAALLGLEIGAIPTAAASTTTIMPAIEPPTENCRDAMGIGSRALPLAIPRRR
jgi:hypothetical protein